MKNATKKNAAAKALPTPEAIKVALEAKVEEVAKDLDAKMAAEHGPNEKYPFGVKLTEAKGISYERFKTAKERDLRLKALTAYCAKKGGAVQPVAHLLSAKPATKAEPELGNPQGITLVGAVKETKTVKTKKTTATDAAKAVKAAKKTDDTLRIRLYAKGEFYFGKLAAARVNGLPNMAVEAKGKTITLTPTKSTKDTVKVMFCHASPVLRVAKLLAETGWSKTTQDLVAKPVGEAGFQVEVK